MFVDPALLPAIQAYGYEPFNDLIITDHRGMYIDFDTQLLFGSKTAVLPPMSGRDIHSTNPHQITSYFKLKQTYLDHQNFANLRTQVPQTQHQPELKP